MILIMITNCQYNVKTITNPQDSWLDVQGNSTSPSPPFKMLLNKVSKLITFLSSNFCICYSNNLITTEYHPFMLKIKSVRIIWPCWFSKLYNGANSLSHLQDILFSLQYSHWPSSAEALFGIKLAGYKSKFSFPHPQQD